MLWWVEDMLCRGITGDLWMVCLARLALCLMMTNLVFLLLYYRFRELVLLRQKGVGMVKKHFGSSPVQRKISLEEGCLLGLLKEEITRGTTGQDMELVDVEAAVSDGGKTWERADLEKVCQMAQKHGVLSLVYEGLAGREAVPQSVRDRVTEAARRAVRQSYHILFLSKFLISRLEAADIKVALLKGVGTAVCYPVPELRKTGDVDLLLIDPKSLDRAKEILLQCELHVSDEQNMQHHVVFVAEAGIEVELHTMLAEPFDNQSINRYLQEKQLDCGRNIQRLNCMGVELPVLATGYHAYELLLHMLQHFLRAGFGLRLLCDWAVFWNRKTESEEREKYLILVQESGLRGFSDMITMFCCDYLGLKRERIAWMNIKGQYDTKGFLWEILEAEEFGKSAVDRMVTLRENSLGAYVREFHHQMHLNFPKTGKYFPLWPGLWLVTLVRFLRNNRRIRGVSVRAVLKKAGQRSRVMEQIRLWKK